MAIDRSPRPSPDTGVTDAAKALLIENVVEGLTFDILRRESFLGRISNTEALKALENFGDTITFRVLNPPSISAYVVNQDLVPQTTAGTNFSITVDNAYYGYPTLDPIDIKQINVPLMSRLAKMLADAHAENEYAVVVAGLMTTVYAASEMAYHGQTPGTVFYNPTTPTAVAQTDRTDGDYIIKQFLKARKRANQMAVPRKGRYAMVNSDVEEILLNSDQFTYQISGNQNAKAIEDGEFGMRVAGFDIIVTDEITTGTYDGQSNIAQCVLGHVNGLGFIRQLMETDVNFKMQTKFGRACRQLDVFGYGLSDSRLMGALPIKVD
jgi:hypothetical protein